MLFIIILTVVKKKKKAEINLNIKMEFNGLLSYSLFFKMHPFKSLTQTLI